ncbi:MAG: hypothetical protein NC203_00135 [Firmicutes bacterium]|nr:hypothetical protein [[Eubacterium] siraeum]MCM1486746.1 hypothetical protein [Bacillota bacterium]
MGRTAKDKRTNDPKPVQRIELSEDNVKKRAIAAVLFLLIGVGLLVYCFMNFLSPGGGWTTIEANRNESDSTEFVFQYYLGASGVNASAENKAVTALYNEITRTQYCLFHEIEGFDNIVNIYSINRSPNKELTVDPALYKVFSQFKEHNSRYIYLAPIYEQYNDLFFCTDDSQLSDFDPVAYPKVKSSYESTLRFVNDPDSVEIQLLGDNKIKLFVSDEYLKYAEEEGITDFIGLMWLKNAFAVDYIADEMTSRGYCFGSVSSYDGFVRNFDSLSSTDYTFNLFDQPTAGGEIYQASAMQYLNRISIVFLRDYDLNSLDVQHYYKLQNGEVRTPYLDINDALPKSSLNNLVSYSKDKGCAEILLEILPLYIDRSFDEAALNSLTDKGINSIYFKDHTLNYNEEGLRLSYLFNQDGVEYKSKYIR